MADDEEAIKNTQATLGTLISKPKMTEKYLKKPPFRFLHDIVMEVTRATTFAQGLYTTEECDAAQLTEKQAKLDFLNKAISVTSFALGEKIDVSANKIVAGYEAEKTNVWLQKLHQAATTCVGEKSEQAVQRVLSGETAAPAKKEKKKKEESDAPPPPPAEDGGDAAAAAAAEEAAKKEEDRKRRAERKKKEEEKKRLAEEEAAKAAAAEAEAAEAPPPPPPADDGEEERKKEEEKKKREEKRRRAEEKKRREAEEEAQRQAEAQAQAEAEAAAAAEAEAPPPPPPADYQDGEDMGGVGGGPGASPDEIAARAEAMLAQRAAETGEDVGMSRPGVRPERPRTAGRKPPKVTSKVTTSEQSTAPVNVAAPVIIGEGNAGDDDEDFFEAPPPPPGAPAVAADAGGQHGALVSNLLAEKKKEEERERLKKEEEETREEFDDGQGKGGIKMRKLKRKKDGASGAVEVDVVQLGGSIQALCQAANPLGKSIDLVHQDIANMNRELDQWKNEYREASEAYAKQLKLTDDLLQPLYHQVAELDDKIAEQKAKIRNSRSRISKNDLKMQGLLESVVMAK
eukprot:TRINITY_DN94147_c0_g1_i1.p1 TRINITY_DN94147_c0_g1~~TRINITY_DN94147_c0_g1_i1.p1  ORF type:complete len:571 (+),score=255.95 TRINITY_DN94147_c0_g1_i1:87-1799(+)